MKKKLYIMWFKMRNSDNYVYRFEYKTKNIHLFVYEKNKTEWLLNTPELALFEYKLCNRNKDGEDFDKIKNHLSKIDDIQKLVKNDNIWEQPCKEK